MAVDCALVFGLEFVNAPHKSLLLRNSFYTLSQVCFIVGFTYLAYKVGRLSRLLFAFSCVQIDLEGIN